MISTTPGPCVLYVRISSDPTNEHLGVLRQEKECRELAARLGWTVGRVYQDNDLSAFKRNVKRPAYIELMTDIAAGKVKRLIAWDYDRITRQPRESEPFIDAIEDGGVVFKTVQAGDDLTTSDGRMQARVRGAFASAASEKTSNRIKSKFRELIEDGQGHGGPRPFGWESDGVTQRPNEIAALIDAKDRILSGQSGLWKICNEWKLAGVKSAKGGTVAVSTLRKILLRPRVIGMMSHRDGVPTVKGKWAPIFTPDEWKQLGLILRNGQGSHRRRAEKPVAYLLTGFLRCSICGGRMFGAAPVGARKVAVYRCQKAPNSTSCGRTHIKVSATDADVMQAVASYLTHVKQSPSLFGGESDAMSAALLELATIENDRNEYMAMGAARTMSPRDVAEMLNMLAPKLKAAEAAWLAAQSSNSGIRELAALDASGFARNWTRMDMAARRKVLQAVGAVVTVGPHVGARNRPSERVRVEVGFTVFDIETVRAE